MLQQQTPAHRLNPFSGARALHTIDRYRPSCWHGPYCGWRLVEAFRTLLHMPSRFGPMLWGSTWPPYRHEWADIVAQYEADSEDLEWRAWAQNRVRLHPSAEAIGFMEEALAWQARYLGNRPIIARSVGRVALLRARGLDFDQVAKRMRRSIPRLKTINQNGLDTIARGLNGDQIAVF